MAHFNSKTSVLFIVLFFIQFSAQAQLDENLRTEILAYITPDAMIFSETETNALEINQIEFLNVDILNTLERYNAISLQKAFPTYLDSDTIVVDENEKEIKIPQFSRIFRVNFSYEEDIESACEELQGLYGILFAEKNMDAYLQNDPYYNLQWYLKNTGQTGGVSGADINIEKAWTYFTGNTLASIGFVDSGVKQDHDDLIGRVLGDSPSGSGHGTMVAGVAAANVNNNKGIKGVDRFARIRSGRIFSPSYVGDATAAQKIIDLSNQAANVINNSWGGQGYSTTLGLGMAYAYKQDRISVVAMGNWYLSGNPTIYPAAYKNGVIAVGATRHNDVKSPFSSTGNHIDLVAPGGVTIIGNFVPEDIYSTTFDGINTYGYTSGTSFSAPLVSGVASLLKWYTGQFTSDDVENILKKSAYKVSGMQGQNWTPYYGSGRLDAGRAFEIIQSPYILTHNNVYGGTVYNSSGYFYMNVFGASGLVDGNYRVKKHEVRKNISFPNYYNHSIWGNSYLTSKGWAAEDESSVNYSTGFCELVPGTLTSSNATLRTYVYEVWSYNYSGQLTYKGWYPADPSNIELNYTLHGVPLSAPPLAPTGLDVSANQYHQASLNWVANIDPDLSQYKIYWASSANGNEPQSFFLHATINAFNGQTPVTTWVDQDVFVGSGNARLYYKISAVDNTSQESSLSESDWVAWDQGMQKWVSGDADIVTEYALEQNYPNPFNPVTTIRYQIPKAGRVTLKVYDILGKEITTLVNEEKETGRYTVNFDASALSSGVYLYEIVVNDYRAVKKLMAIK